MTPVEFNTIAVADGIALGTGGMRASLNSREVIADSIELAVCGHCLDGIAILVGCDKTIPAAASALARLNLPGIILYGGSIRPARHKGKFITVQEVFEAVGAEAFRIIDKEGINTIEKATCPGPGACDRQFTAKPEQILAVDTATGHLKRPADPQPAAHMGAQAGTDADLHTGKL